MTRTVERLWLMIRRIVFRPDMTETVDWALKTSAYLPTMPRKWAQFLRRTHTSIFSLGLATHPTQVPANSAKQTTHSLAGSGTVQGQLLSSPSSRQTQAGHQLTTPSSKLIGGASVTSLPPSLASTGSNPSPENVILNVDPFRLYVSWLTFVCLIVCIFSLSA